MIFKGFFLAWNVIIILGVTWPVSCMATSSSATVTDDLLQLLNDISTMQAHFVQTSVNMTGSVVGDMALRRPGKFRWETKQPQHQLIVANGKHVWFYDVDLDQVVKQTLDANDKANPAQLLSGDNATIRATFVVTSLKSDSGEDRCFALSPINKNNIYRKVNLCFDSSNKLSRMTMEDNLGQVSNFVFSKVVINNTLSTAPFEFVAPKGVDVIDNS